MPEEPNDDEVEELLELATLLAAACCVWWILAGAIWLYWAAGGTVGVGTLWGGSEALSGIREPWLSTLLWGFSIFQLGLATLGLAISQRRTLVGLLTVVNTSAFLIGLTLVPYVAVDTVLRGLMLIGVLETIALDGIARAWRLLFWNPWWVVGVLLYCAAAWLYRYASDQRPTEHSSST